MTRKERLPKNVTSFVDRHGKRRYRYRSKGQSHSFRAHPNSAEGKAELAAALAGRRNPAEREAPGTVGELAAKWIASPAFAGNKGPARLLDAQRILAPFVAKFRKGLVADFRFDHIERYLAEVAVPRVESGRKRGGPHAAKNLRDELLPMFRYAIKLGLVETNPVALADIATPPKSKGFHTWSEEEIAQFRAAHQLGTMARFVLELALNTSGRRCNIARLAPADIRNGRIVVDHAKNGNEASVRMLPATRAAYEALPVKSTLALVVTSFGRPFSVPGLGNKMREWCDSAGLPHCTLHGLRKATSRRVAESGGTDAEGMSVTGQKKSETFTHYRAAANRQQLADEALDKVTAKFDLANPPGTDRES
ncbi:site-specific integrase [Tsuneonella sp. HG222]